MSSFKQYFPLLTSFLEEFFATKENMSVEEVAKTLVQQHEYQRIYELLLDINRFNASQTTPPVKTKDLLFILDCNFFGLTPLDFLQHIKNQLRVEMANILEQEHDRLAQVTDAERTYYYLLKWDIELKRSFITLIRKESEKLSPVSLYVLTQPMLINMQWKDGQLVDDILGIERINKGYMNATKLGERFAVEKNQNFSLTFSDGTERFAFSCNLQFMHNRPFYEFPPMLSYEDMALIEQQLLRNFPYEAMLRELSV